MEKEKGKVKSEKGTGEGWRCEMKAIEFCYNVWCIAVVGLCIIIACGGVK